jgi:hypothetical protein
MFRERRKGKGENDNGTTQRHKDTKRLKYWLYTIVSTLIAGAGQELNGTLLTLY